jgi:hypothetical protein
VKLFRIMGDPVKEHRPTLHGRVRITFGTGWGLDYDLVMFKRVGWSAQRKMTGFWITKHVVRITFGSKFIDYSTDDFEKIKAAMQSAPIFVMSDDSAGKKWWLYCGVGFVENEYLDAQGVYALAHADEERRQRKLQNAMDTAHYRQDTPAGTSRAIPAHVKQEVYNRDGGRCCKCGSNINLEFDHIIPFSKGGSNTARNIQLLCLMCNRAKRASII